jgi:8-oxo-dGTP diphosphatase
MKSVALIVLINKEKKILLQHRSADAPINPSKWGFFGGRIEREEVAVEAVKRECQEELNYALENPKLLWEGEYGDCYAYIYTEEYNPKKEITLKEGRGLGWFSMQESEKLDASKQASDTFKIIFKLLNS